jgi:predicted tellurium resistance membrane protein TerC
MGIALALVIRIGLLFTLSWLMQLTAPLFTVAGNEFSGRDLILLAGGLFLVAKAAHEMHAKLEGKESQGSPATSAPAAAGTVLAQILVLDIVFSLDSVITAVGMATQLWVMITAMILSVVVMLVSAGAIGDFVERHPTVKILALSFLLLIGVVLIAEGFGQHISKGYIYFAMAFALAVELLNMRLRKVQEPVHLRAGTERTAAKGMAGGGSP